MGLWSYAKGLLGGNRASKLVGGYELWSMPMSASGEVVTQETAMRVSAVYTCVRILSQTMGMVPLNIYRKKSGGGRELATEHPLYKLFRQDRTNKLQTYFEFKELLQQRLCLRGNAYAYIEMDRRGKITSLRPLAPDFVVPEEKNGEITYKYYTSKGTVTFSQDEILHIKGMSADGLTGLSPIDIMMDVIGSGIATDKYGATSFKNGARIGGILSHPGKLDKATADRLRETWAKQYSGSENSGKTAILEQGMDFKPVGMTNEQAQWLDSKKLNRAEIFGIFQVPPHMAGDLERATFSNIEQQSLDFITYTMTPWFSRWEAALGCSLLSESEQEEYFFKFNASSFLRGDALSRAQKLAIERANGIISANEWRALEEYNPLEGDAGDKILIPMNMADANEKQEPQGDSEGQPPRTPGGKQQEPANVNQGPKETQPRSKRERLLELRPATRAILKRLIDKEHKALEKENFAGIAAWIQKNGERHTDLLKECAKPLADIVGTELRLLDSLSTNYASELLESQKNRETVEQRLESMMIRVEQCLLGDSI